CERRRASAMAARDVADDARERRMRASSETSLTSARPTLPDVFVPFDLAVIATGRHERTIRTWARRLKVRSVCDVRTRGVRVALADVVRANLS
ncbi:MAG TPA: hypothetical protein VGD55_06995, partial [Acidothermaceae bacterium]